MTLKIVYRQIDEIKPYEKNPRINDKAVQYVANSIKEFGFKNPIIIDRNDIIIAGHTRLSAAQSLGLKEVPTIRADDLTEEQVKAFRLADNKTAELADWDFDLLGGELEDISLDMTEYGFTSEELDFAISDGESVPIEEDEYEPEDIPTTAKKGDIWKLGAHYLLCGDVTDKSQLEKLFKVSGGQLADMVFTDPPYNVSIGTKNAFLNTAVKGERCITPVRNDGDDGQTDEEVGEALWYPAFANMRDFSKKQCSLYVTMPQGGTHMMMMMIDRAGWKVKHELMWLKNVPTFSMNRLDYDYQHEPILYGWNESHKWTGGGEFNKSVWTIDRVPHCDIHPTMKPIKLISNAILNSTDKNDIVLDCFGGSGSTMIACEQTERRCLMMELDPHYCDVIIERWEQFTGNKAELLDEGEHGEE